jgi:hypothetical protein
MGIVGLLKILIPQSPNSSQPSTHQHPESISVQRNSPRVGGTKNVVYILERIYYIWNQGK